MIIEEIKKANIEAMRNKDSNLRTIYSVIINKYMQLEIGSRTTGQKIEEVNNIKAQREAISKYLPELLSKEKIKEIILTLEDKTVPSVMRHFKTNYNGQCDMKDVSEVLKSL